MDGIGQSGFIVQASCTIEKGGSVHDTDGQDGQLTSDHGQGGIIVI